MNIRQKQQSYLRSGILLGSVVIVALAAFFYHQHQTKKETEAASAVYEKILQSLKQKDGNKTESLALKIMQDYRNTSYAHFAALMLARIELEKNNPNGAIKHLEFILKNNAKEPVLHIATVRLARVLHEQARDEEALRLVEGDNVPQGYITLYEEMKGDIYLKQNQIEKAKAAFDKAIKAAPQNASTATIQLKRNELQDS